MKKRLKLNTDLGVKSDFFVQSGESFIPLVTIAIKMIMVTMVTVIVLGIIICKCN